MPHLKELYAKYQDQGLVLIGVHTKNAGDKMAGFVEEQGIEYPVALDADGDTVKAFAVDSFPDYYMIDRSGVLRFADLANAEVDRAVLALLAEKAPAIEKPDAEPLFAAALASAKKQNKNVLVHVHGPG